MATGIGKGRTITCNFCETTGLRWDKAYMDQTRTPGNPNGVMRLWNPATGQVHACDLWQKKLERYSDGTEPVFRVAEAPDEPTQSEYPLPEYINDAATGAIQTAINDSGISRAEAERLIAREKAERESAEALIRYDISEDNRKLRSLLDSSNQVLLGELARLEKNLNSSRTLEILALNGEVRKLDRQHYLFPDLLEYTNLRFNVMLVGPAGSGKTTGAEKAAEALGLTFYLFPMGPAVTESRLLGWIDANGKLVRTLFREAYEHGGVFMADEMDNCNASALTTLNGALANGVVGFPDGMIKRHADFVFIGGANTYGRGADRMYVGRQQLDAATLDRFLIVNWDYDESFELYLAGDDQQEWVKYVQKIRRIAFDNKLRVLVSPRASIEGAKLLRHGIDRKRVEEIRLWAGMPETEKATIKNNLRY